jgi:hypothetical protein
MNRTELFDKLLNHKYENQKGFRSLLEISATKFGIKDRMLVESILEEMLERDLVQQTNYDQFSVMINYNGKQVIENYGSYSSLLESEKVSQKKAQRSKMTPDVIKIGIAIIFGISTAILGWLNYIDNNKIDNQKIEINELNKRIDSLQTESEKRTTTPYKKNAVDSAKTKG